MGKAQTGKEILDEVKNKQKETNMKNNKLQTIITVIVTLVAVATLIGMFYLGTQFQNGVNHEVATQVKELATVISTKK